MRSSTRTAKGLVGRFTWRRGSSNGTPRRSPTSSSASLLNWWGWSGMGGALVLGLIEPAVAHERTEGSRDGDVEARIAVEKTEFQHVGAEEAPERAEDGGDAAALGLLLAHEQIGEGINLRDMAGERRKRVMVQVASQRRDGTIAFDLPVDDRIAAP